VAVLLVVAFHARLPVPGGFVGVDVFFVISGFVITAMLQREWLAHGRIRFREFYVRRFKRLTPALALMVTVTVIASALLLSPLGTQQTAAQTAIGAMLLVANVVIARTTGGYFDAPAEANPLLNTWSLSVEEQFYLAFPFVLVLGWLLLRRSARARFAPLLIVAAVTLVSFALSVASARGYDLHLPMSSVGFYGPLTRAWEFGAGSLIALAAAWLARPSAAIGTLLGVVGAAMVIASAFVITAETPYPGSAALLPVAGTVLLILAGSGSPNPVSSLLGVRPMVGLGNLSYSWYLWHWPVIVFAMLTMAEPRPVVAAAVSILPALASYRWLEQPVRRLPILSGPRLRWLVSITLVPPLAMAGLLWLAASSGFWMPTVRTYQAAVGVLHAGAVNGCDEASPTGAAGDGACVWNRSAPGQPIYLVGDSNADHFSEAVIGAGAELGRPVLISTAKGCPFVDASFTYLPGTDASNDLCREYVAGTLAWLEASPPGLVIMASSDEYWTDPSYAAGLTGATETTDASSKLGVLAAGLGATASTLQESGHDVLMVQTVPHFRPPYGYDPEACSLSTLLSDSCWQQMPLSAYVENQGGSSVALAEAAASTGSTVLDLSPRLCPAESCATRVDDRVAYADQAHISVPESERLIPELREAIEASAAGGTAPVG
jgi:peptidoglycan/LPS O-acetylase OafA/YrhL